MHHGMHDISVWCIISILRVETGRLMSRACADCGAAGISPATRGCSEASERGSKHLVCNQDCMCVCRWWGNRPSGPRRRRNALLCRGCSVPRTTRPTASLPCSSRLRMLRPRCCSGQLPKTGACFAVLLRDFVWEKRRGQYMQGSLGWCWWELGELQKELCRARCGMLDDEPAAGREV